MQLVAGERRLPACSFRQPAENILRDTRRNLAASATKPCRPRASGKLPDAAGWQPALPGARDEHQAKHFSF
jgi:hypothetical protein